MHHAQGKVTMTAAGDTGGGARGRQCTVGLRDLARLGGNHVMGTL